MNQAQLTSNRRHISHNHLKHMYWFWDLAKFKPWLSRVKTTPSFFVQEEKSEEIAPVVSTAKNTLCAKNLTCQEIFNDVENH